MILWIVLLTVGVLAALVLLACLLWCWGEPVRRGGYVTDLRKERP